MTSSVECDFGFASPRTEQACDGLTRAGMQGFKRFASTIESILSITVLERNGPSVVQGSHLAIFGIGVITALCCESVSAPFSLRQGDLPFPKERSAVASSSPKIGAINWIL